MAGMALSVSAKFEELIKLKNEIEKTKEALKAIDREADPKGFKQQERTLKSLQKEHSKLYESLSPVIHEYRNLEKTGREAIGNIAKITEANNLKEQIDIQKKAVAELAEEYRKTEQELNSMGSDTGKNHLFSDKELKEGVVQYQEKKKQVDKLKTAYDGEKKALTELQTEYGKVTQSIEKTIAHSLPTSLR